MLSRKRKSVNPLSLMALCSQLTAIKDPQSADAKLIDKLIEQTFKTTKNACKIAFFNSLIKAKLQSETIPKNYLKIIFKVVSDCLDISKVFLIINKSESFQTFELTTEFRLNSIDVSFSVLQQNFERAFDFLKLNVTTSEVQQIIFKAFPVSDDFSKLHAHPVYSEFKLKGDQRVKILAYLITEKRSIKLTQKQKNRIDPKFFRNFFEDFIYGGKFRSQFVG